MRDEQPGAWRTTTFGDIATRLVNGGTPPTDVAALWTGNIPWITGADFTPSGVGEFRRFVSSAAITRTATNVIDKGELLLVTRTGVGKLAIAPCDIAISQDITGVYADRKQVNALFLYHRMRKGVEELKKLNQGTSINGIIRGDLLKYSIELPPLPHQERIAEILSTLDEAIEQTEALIAKTQAIKTGLMHDLFTRGVTANGELRPPREEAPQLYKESLLGLVPITWRAESLRLCLRENPTNGIYKPAELIGRGNLLVGQAAFSADRHLDFSLARRAVVSADELSRFSLAENDLLVSRVFATVDGVGQPVLVPALPEPAVFESNMMRLRINTAVVRPRLLFEWLRCHRARRFIVAGVNASNQASINQQVLNPLPVLIPSSQEQERIEALIESHDERFATDQRTLEKLREMKHGLMHDLLTGRVPVPLPEPGALAANA